VLSAELDPAVRTARLRLGVLLHPTDADSPQPERTIVLRRLSRVIVRLRRVRHKGGSGAEAAGPPVLLRDATAVVSWLRRWSGCHLYDQPGEIFDSSTRPAWLSQPSIDLTWPAGPERRHTMDLMFANRRGPGGHTYTLDVHFEFGGLEVLTSDGTPDDADALADAVTLWWHDMHAGHTNGQYGIYPADNAPALSASEGTAESRCCPSKLPTSGTCRGNCRRQCAAGQCAADQCAEGAGSRPRRSRPRCRGRGSGPAPLAASRHPLRRDRRSRSPCPARRGDAPRMLGRVTPMNGRPANRRFEKNGFATPRVRRRSVSASHRRGHAPRR